MIGQGVEVVELQEASAPQPQIPRLAHDAADSSQDDPALSWLLADPHRHNEPGDPTSEFLVLAAPGLEILPALLQRLAELQIMPRQVEVDPPGVAVAAILLQVGAMEQRRCQALAEGLTRCRGVHRVACRQGAVFGGLFLSTGRRLAARPRRQRPLVAAQHGP